MVGGLGIVAAPKASAPALAPPAGACDAHSHVFGPFDRFPPLQASVYALPDASPPAHASVRETLGMSRGVLTQPAPYAHDPAAMLSAIAEAPDCLRGVAAADSTIEDATLERWKAGGIVALRFVEMRAPNGQRYPGSVGFDQLLELAPRMRKLGLHAQLWATATDIASWVPTLLAARLPLVLDHMACPEVEAGADGENFRRILEFGETGDVWIKLTLCRVSKTASYQDVRPFHDALIRRMPHRLVWGSDWPYVRMSPEPDAGNLLNTFHEWTTDDNIRRRILVDNPAWLYGFKGKAL